MSIQSCMGGWCTKRDHCANYHAATTEQEPSQRLCQPGGVHTQIVVIAGESETDDEGEDMAEINPRNLWRHEKREWIKAQVVAEVRKRAPISATRLHEVTGYSKIVNTHELLSELAAAGSIFSARIPFSGWRAESVLFADEVSRDLALAKAKTEIAQRAKEADTERMKRRAAAQKAERAGRVAEKARIRAEKKAAKEAARTKRLAEREELKRLRELKKANTTKAVVKVKKAPGNPRTRNDNAIADMLRKQRRSDEAREKKVAVKIEPDFSRAKVTIAPRPPERWSVEIPQVGGFSSMRPGQYAFDAQSCAARAAG